MKLSPEEQDYKFCPSCKTDLSRKLIDGRQRFYCPECNFIFWNNPKPVVSILLMNKGRILMLQRADEPLKGYWCLPGGFVNYDETPWLAIKREVKEEAGVDIKIDNLIGVYQIDNDPRGIHIDIIFSGKSYGDIKINKESTVFRYFKPSKLPDKIAYKHRQAIKDNH